MELSPLPSGAATKTSPPGWFPDWSSDVCAIVASGPSVTREDVETLKDRCRVAVVNNNHQLAPWADLLYAADGKWWGHYKAASCFDGLKVTSDAAAATAHRLHHVVLLGDIDTDHDRIDVARPGWIARGGNSAFQLVNIVTQLGVKKQIWIGFDFLGSHWHDNHPDPLKNPRPHTLEKWCKRLDAQAPILSGLGVEVINASAQSALSAYRKMPLADALAHFGVQ